MKVLVFSPYGFHSPGYATTHMMLRYLHSLCAEVVQLHCNGAFSVCERDLQRGEQQRTLEHCLRCSAEQRELVDFIGGQAKNLTEFLSGEDLQKSRQWVLERDAEEVWNDAWFGLSLSDLTQKTFQRFTGEAHPRFKSQKHSGLIKQLALTAIRMSIASGKCVNQLRPEWVWIPSGDEMLTKSLFTSASMRSKGMPKMQLVTFQTALDDQMLLVQREGDKQPYRVQNVIDSLADVRTDIESWPKEVIAEFDDFFRYLGISISQLGLPVAR